MKTPVKKFLINVARISIAYLFIIIIGFSFASCSSASSIDTVLSVEYNLEEIDAYIKPRNTHKLAEAPPLSIEDILFYHDLDAKYPIEIFRICDNTAYTVYKISDGGYYYVFWTFAYPSDSGRDASEDIDWADKEYLCVLFSIYIDSDPSDQLDYAAIQPGTTSLSDLIEMDANIDRRFTVPYDYYYYLNRNDVLQVRCKLGELYEDNAGSAENIIVESVSVIPRDESSGYLAYINDEDLP